MNTASGSVFIVVAPSGAGKTSLVSALLQADTSIELSVSYATRQPRVNEMEGVHYHFITVEQFEGMIEHGDFLEYAHVYGNYYGTSYSWLEQRLALGKDVLLEIDWQGYLQVKARLPEAVSIFILPPSMGELESRLRGRATDTDEVIERRLSAARFEISQLPVYDYVIFNDGFENAKSDLLAVVKAARLRGLIQQRRHADALARMQPLK